MENEELAALRATLLAAQRQPLAVKVRQARLSALLADGATAPSSARSLPSYVSWRVPTSRVSPPYPACPDTSRFRRGPVGWPRFLQC